MFIEHVSDSHGRMFSYNRHNSILIHSGDMLPNSDYIFADNLEKEIEYQKNWVIKNISLFPSNFVFTLGNHDFVDGFELEQIFKGHGISAVCLHDKIVNYGGLRLYGFPYIPKIAGMWNYECDSDQMLEHANRMIAVLSGVDCIVAHSPLGGILDYIVPEAPYFSGGSVGNHILSNKLNYIEHNVKYYLHGHIHEQHGIAIKNGMLISNAATVKNYIEF